MAATDASHPGQAGVPRTPWHWHPDLPLRPPPVSRWPWRPPEVLSWLFGRGVLFSQHTVFVGLAVVAWWWLTPPLETMARFEAGWMLQV